MKRLALAIALAACSHRSGDAMAERSWWCSAAICEATQEACTRMMTQLHFEGTCTPHATAVCSHGCEDLGSNQLCSPTCAVDREACEMDKARAATCREQPPPAHPDLFPGYVEPGWWCGELQGGAVSSCEKAKEKCEATLHVTCTRPTGPVYCWSRRIVGNAGRLAFMCTTTEAFCEQTLAQARTMGSGQFEIASGCAVWPYD